MSNKKNSKNHEVKNITLGLVAARKGSVGVRGKNLIKIQNEEIAKTAIKLALKCKSIDKVIVSSDSVKILNLTNKNSKLIKLRRNNNLAKNNTPMLPVILFDSGIIILTFSSSIALLKHSSNVLQEIIFAFG